MSTVSDSIVEKNFCKCMAPVTITWIFYRESWLLPSTSADFFSTVYHVLICSVWWSIKRQIGRNKHPSHYDSFFPNFTHKSVVCPRNEGCNVFTLLEHRFVKSAKFSTPLLYGRKFTVAIKQTRVPNDKRECVLLLRPKHYLNLRCTNLNLRKAKHHRVAIKWFCHPPVQKRTYLLIGKIKNIFNNRDTLCL
ncbi:uncharacterized protein LOC123987761 [Osmia bicornis bicornis]|uniref:uncharacterized protein LOC123987761 n=1 Tax=Osmia bicornis bicornis TaxID=1437191 RepID=UPI001EAEDBE6|nr:uncharacterized protein LOC123987761 [Osmia bicornis bicornis]